MLGEKWNRWTCLAKSPSFLCLPIYLWPEPLTLQHPGVPTQKKRLKLSILYYFMLHFFVLYNRNYYIIFQWRLLTKSNLKPWWNLIRSRITFLGGLMQYTHYVLCLFLCLKRLFQVASAEQTLSDRSADEWAWEYSVTDSWLAYEMKQPRTFFPGSWANQTVMPL